MQFEMADKNCPLCKRMVATNGHPDSTRLCEECRSLIRTIMPATGLSSFAAVEQAQISAQPRFASMAGIAAPLSFDEDLTGDQINSLDRQVELSSFDPVTDFDEVQVDLVAEPEYFDGFETDEIDEGDAQPHVESLDDPIDEPTAQPHQPAEPQDAAPQVFLMPEPREAEAVNLKSLLAAKEAETITAPEAASDQETTDPWDDPLPTWEYSRNEYPLYVGVSERRRGSKFKSLFVPALLFMAVVAAYLVFQSASGAPKNKQEAENSEQAVKTESEPPAAQPPAAPTQAEVATKPVSNDAEKVAATPSDASANATTQWRHALQALASPSEDEANEFARKLVSAGVPAYVIPADIERRGKWFRVRIGGFNTAQEAQKFIAESKARAKAAGITLKSLNVVDYEKP